MAKRTVVEQKNTAKKVKRRGTDGLFWLLECYEGFPRKMLVGHIFAPLKVKDHCN